MPDGACIRPSCIRNYCQVVSSGAPPNMLPHWPWWNANPSIGNDRPSLSYAREVILVEVMKWPPSDEGGV